MNKEYYTPEIEDLYIGYELEKAKLKLLSNHSSKNETYIENWEKFILDENDIQFICILIRGNSNIIRTPYLTKEQIEKEGWEYSYSDFSFGVFFRDKEEDRRFRLQYDYESNFLDIQIVDTDDVSTYGNIFCGKCPSINEFRKICKLLGINE